MCRNIKPLYTFAPPVSDDCVRDAALQYVRKISGFNKPSKAKEGTFQATLDAVAAASSTLLRRCGNFVSVGAVYGTADPFGPPVRGN